MWPGCLPSGFNLIWLSVQEEMSFEEFQNGRHAGQHGYRNRTSLAIWNFLDAQMLPKKYLLNPTNPRSGADIDWRFYRWVPWRPSWISERNDFGNQESPCRPNASHQVSAQSDFPFGRRCRFNYFKMAAIVAILDIGTDDLSNSEFPFCPNTSL